MPVALGVCASHPKITALGARLHSRHPRSHPHGAIISIVFAHSFIPSRLSSLHPAVCAPHLTHTLYDRPLEHYEAVNHWTDG